MLPAIADVLIQPKLEALERLNLTPNDFYHALYSALEALDGTQAGDLPAPGAIRLWMGGKHVVLGDIAAIHVHLEDGPAKHLHGTPSIQIMNSAI
jgi:hypothetical protein